MPVLVWDEPGLRVYENGLDRGVLYLPDGTAVPWNGLTSVVEKFDKATSSVYFDGMKIQDFVVLGDFSATMKAVTYPDEFLEIEGIASMRHGVSFEDQSPLTFGLCWRTQIGDDVDGDAAGYKIHLLYNVTAIPSDKTYATASNSPSLVEFEWTIVAVPEEIPGFRPTAHIIVDSRKIDPLLLSQLEAKIYGDTSTSATLIPMSDLVSWLNDWYRIKVTDNGDGTFAIDIQDDLVDSLLTWLDGTSEGEFQLKGANAIFHVDETEYDLSDTMDASDIAEITIEYNVDGSWTATADSDALILLPGDGTFTIVNAEAIFLDADTYRISDTQFGS